LGEANDNLSKVGGTVRVPPNPHAFSVAQLHASADALDRLAEILVLTVAGGGSVSFMHPLSQAAARAFWEGALAAAARNERVVLGAFDGDVLLGTVTLLLAFPENQPHRCEIAKMMTHPEHRNRGVATALLKEAERLAAEHGKTLIVLDTAQEGGAGEFYETRGYTQAGAIPDFALTPHGGLTPTLLYWKQLKRKSVAVGPPGLVGIVRTSWPNIRYALFRRADGAFEFFEQHLSGGPGSGEGGTWVSRGGSRVYEDMETARDEMIRVVEAFEDT
jgi:GNAT superfamily N-acetyltransferase